MVNKVNVLAWVAVAQIAKVNNILAGADNLSLFFLLTRIVLAQNIAITYNRNREGNKMEKYIGDFGILFASGLVLLYMMWDKLFRE